MREHSARAGRPLRFHWSLSQAGDPLRRERARTQMSGTPDVEAQLALCRLAEVHGIESMLMAIGFTRPDPLVLSVALARGTERIKFMVACRSGLLSPTTFVQQVNTASALTGGRICVNIVAGHTPKELHGYGDFLGHDERYARTDEFLTVCRAFWQANGDGPVDFDGVHYKIENGLIGTPFVGDKRAAPEIFLGGNSDVAAALAAKHADCLWRFPEAPAKLAAGIAPVLAAGKEAGLLVSLISRRTREEAVAAARALAAGRDSRRVHRDLGRDHDSVGFRAAYALADHGDEWLTPVLWTGAIPHLGPPAIALVGSYEEIAEAIEEYARAGVTQFLFMGWPDDEEMDRFGREVLPLVRACGLVESAPAARPVRS